MFLGRTLYIDTIKHDKTGAAVISERNLQLVQENSSYVIYHTVSLTITNVKRNLSSVLVYQNLISKHEVEIVLKRIREDNITSVFVDTSLLGNLVMAIRKALPKTYILGFFHNVEINYFKELIRASGKLHHYITLLLVRKAERQMTLFADAIITLNRRDSESVKTSYGKFADLVLPTSFQDKYVSEFELPLLNKSEILKILFVGSYFPPNIFGIEWFVDNVLNSIKRDVILYVVGSGFENHTFKNATEEIKIVGRVEDLASFYYSCDLVIAPIFHGSGMKTKVAEALMFNKPILGSKEAFEGYEIDINKIGGLADNKEEYLKFIDNFENSKYNQMRTVFLENYSFKRIGQDFYSFLNG